MITRSQVFTSAAIAAALSIFLLVYLLQRVSPYQTNTDLDKTSIALFLMGIFVFATSIGIVIALVIHQRWPSLAGSTKYAPAPLIAVRQGILLAVAIIAIALLALMQILDIVFIAFVVLVVGLFEAFLQNRSQ